MFLIITYSSYCQILNVYIHIYIYTSMSIYIIIHIYFYTHLLFSRLFLTIACDGQPKTCRDLSINILGATKKDGKNTDFFGSMWKKIEASKLWRGRCIIFNIKSWEPKVPPPKATPPRNKALLRVY